MAAVAVMILPETHLLTFLGGNFQIQYLLPRVFFFPGESSFLLINYFIMTTHLQCSLEAIQASVKC